MVGANAMWDRGIDAQALTLALPQMYTLSSQARPVDSWGRYVTYTYAYIRLITNFIWEHPAPCALTTKASAPLQAGDIALAVLLYSGQTVIGSPICDVQGF